MQKVKIEKSGIHSQKICLKLTYSAIAKGDTLFEQNDRKNKNIYFLLRGIAIIQIRKALGDEKRLSMIKVKTKEIIMPPKKKLTKTQTMTIIEKKMAKPDKIPILKEILGDV